MEDKSIEAIQNVVDRVSSYQDGAPEGTVDKELRAGLDEVGVELSEEQVVALVEAVEADAGEVRAGDVLG